MHCNDVAPSFPINISMITTYLSEREQIFLLVFSIFKYSPPLKSIVHVDVAGTQLHRDSAGRLGRREEDQEL